MRKLVLVVCPIILPGGRPLFGDKTAALDVKLVDAKAWDRGAVSLTYVPRGSRQPGTTDSR